MRRVLAIFTLLAAVLATLAAAPPGLETASDPGDPVPYPDPAFLEPVDGGECTYENEYDAGSWTEGRYGDACKRIEFHFGPLTVKPGQNEALIEPVDIEKPAYDGYVVRFKPDLVRSVDGSHPNTEDLHLHHATWLDLYSEHDSYGNGPFFAAGEEKTVGNLPDGYGMLVGGNDLWGLLYMIHNAGTQPEEVWIRYTIDYVEKSAGDELGIVPAKPLWLDVQGPKFHEEQADVGGNVVFNAQRGFGGPDPETGHHVCRWPDDNCARFDFMSKVSAQQGLDVSDQVDGTDWTVNADMAGTIVIMGGHLHPGGIRDEVSLVRDGVEKDIFISDAIYWDHDNPELAGGPPTSWNLSMTTISAKQGWKVKVREGDIIRINAVVDTELASWYEGMGIVMGFIAPADPHGVEGVDVFEEDVVLDRGTSIHARTPEGPYLDDWRPNDCVPDLTDADGDGQKRLCLRGGPTHGAVPESGATGDCSADGTCPPLPDKKGSLVTEIHSVGFTYGTADFGVIGVNGIPQMKLGEPVKFINEDAPARIWHTFTRCKKPCTGPTTVNYPIADGGNGSPDDHMDFESMEIGWGLTTEPTKSQVPGEDFPSQEWVERGLVWEFTPSEAGVFTFFCRVHPSMRGAFEVVP